MNNLLKKALLESIEKNLPGLNNQKKNELQEARGNKQEEDKKSKKGAHRHIFFF